MPENVVIQVYLMENTELETMVVSTAITELFLISDAELETLLA
jgi:hypothetical protein